jgi:small-conductance mechanosensitive channel
MSMKQTLRLLVFGALWLICPAIALAQAAPPATGERPFSVTAEIWMRTLDRIAQAANRPNLLDAEVEQMRNELTGIRQAATAAAAQARVEATSLRTLLVPLETPADRSVKPADQKAAEPQPPEPDTVRQQRDQLRADLGLVEGRIKQAELIVARADLLTAQLTKARGDQFARAVLKRGSSPLAPSTWLRLGDDVHFAWRTQTASWRALADSGALTATLRDRDRRNDAILSVVGLLVAWLALSWLRRRYGRGTGISEPSYRDRAIAAALEGLGMVALPVVAILLILSWLPAVQASPEAARPALSTIDSIAHYTIFFLMIYGLSEASLTPRRPAWRLLPFSADSASAFCNRIQRLAAFVAIAGPLCAFWLLRLPGGADEVAGLAAIAGVAISGGLLLFGLPTLRSDAWQSSALTDGGTPGPIGGYSWLLARLALGLVGMAILVAALLGYTALAIHSSDALLDSLCIVFLAIVVHALVHDVVEAVGAPDTRPGRWLRRVFGLAPDAEIYGRFVVVLLADLVLIAGVAFLILVVWGADAEDILDKAGRLMAGFSIGQHRVSPVDIAIALLVFMVVLGAVRFLRGLLRERFLPSLRLQDDVRLSIDSMVNYVGIVIALLLGVSALGIDFTSLALIISALSVGIGLGLQSLANNTISGVVLLLERPIKVGDRVIVGGFEGIVRRINVRATEIETGQRARVIVPNSQFLQSAVVNATYADNIGRIDVPVTVTTGSDPEKVEAILRQAASDTPHIAALPRPLVLFRNIRPGGLDFELRAHVDHPENTIVAQNALNRSILAGLAKGGIAVAEPSPAVPPQPGTGAISAAAAPGAR